MSNDLHTLSGAYAIDALSAGEVEQFRKHLDSCPVCAQEVRELQQAAASMGASEALQPPAHLKARVLAEVDRTPQLPPRAPGDSNVVPLAPRQWGRMLMAAAAVVAVIVAGAVGISQIGRDDTGTLSAGVVRVFKAPDAHKATMKTTNGGTISVATSPELGEMAVDTDELPELGSGQVYQIWAIHDGAFDSVGVVERERGAAMAMPSPDTEVAITVEPAGGSAQPTTQPIMQVNPSAV